MGPHQGPVASDDLKNLERKKSLSMVLLRMKFATKWAFIKVLNPGTKLYRDIEICKDVKKKTYSI